MLKHRWSRYLLIVLLLLLYFGIRIIHLDALPLFIDESWLVESSVQVRGGSLVGFGYHGKFLLPWLFALMLPGTAIFWTVRVLTLLLVMIGAASLVRLGRQLADWSIGLLALLVTAFTPMLFFFDRLALTDTTLHAMLTFFVLMLFWTFIQPTPRVGLAIGAGVAFILALLAKSTALVLLPLPLVAVLLLPKGWIWRDRLRITAMLYATILVLWLPLQLLLMSRGINYFGLAGQFTSGIDHVTLMEKLVRNSSVILNGMVGYFGWPLLLLAGVAYVIAVMKQPRRSMFFLAMMGGLVCALILTGRVEEIAHRYWLGMIPIALLLLVFGFSQILKRSLLIIGVVGYAVLVGLPFIWTAYTAPFTLPLPAADRLAYIEADSAGSRIPEVATMVEDYTEVTVGAFPQCYTLNLYTQSAVQCLDVIADNQRVRRINRDLAQVQTPFLLILEEPGYITETDISAVSLTPLASYIRPGEKMTIQIYRAG